MAVEEPFSKQRYRKITGPNGVAEVWLQDAGEHVELHTVRLNGRGTARWKRCDVAECWGEAIADGKCLRHLERAHRATAIVQSSKRGSVSLRGTRVDDEMLSAVAEAAIRDGEIIKHLSFAGAEILARVQFEDLAIRSMDLTGAIIRQPFSLTRCTVAQVLSASFVYFNAGPPHFRECQFGNGVNLSHAHAERVSIGFTACTFSGGFVADGVDGALLMPDCTFSGAISLRGANATIIQLDRAVVEGVVTLDEAHCQAVRATGARITSANQFGPCRIENDLTLKNCRFEGRVLFDLSAKQVNLEGSRFDSGGSLRVTGANVDLKRVSTAAVLWVSGAESDQGSTRIMALEESDAGNMAFGSVDMSQCNFYGAHDLGGIQVEPTVKFASAPKWGPFGGRQCVADEVGWRARKSLWKGRWEGDSDVDDSEPGRHQSGRRRELRAAQVAGVYRDLRRSFESSSNEPGAADFYYGEMEMRRHSSTVPLAERVILWLYWALSGYGLRASRALLGLVALIAAATVLLERTKDGLPDWSASLLSSLRATIPGLSVQANLNKTGEAIEIALTLLGPVLLGLAILALRGRVKR